MNLDKFGIRSKFYVGFMSATALGAQVAAGQTAPAEHAAQSAPADPAPAQAGTGLQDIIVTARRREETLVRAPVAVTGVSAQTIANYNLDSMSKVAASVPFTTVVNNGVSSVFSIRGISSSPQDVGLPQSVSVLLDGFQASQGNIAQIGLFDLAQVQVLKGPQALFFGKNSPAGVINFTSRDPGSRLEANFKAGYEFNAREALIDAGISGPLTETLGARVALHYVNQQGYLYNNAGSIVDPVLGVTYPDERGRVPDNKEIDGRVTLVWKPIADLTAKLKVLAGHLSYGDAGFNQTITSCAPGATKPQVVVGGYTFTDPQNTCRFGTTNVNGGPAPQMLKGLPTGNTNPFTDQNSVVASLNLNYRGSAIDLTSITSYGHYKRQGLANYSGSSYFWYGSFFNEKFSSLQQELRASSHYSGPINLTVGGFFETGRVEQENYGFNGPLGPDPVTGYYFATHSDPHENSQSYSVFGEIRYDITPKLELSGGARYSYDGRQIHNIGNLYVHTYLAPYLLPAGEILQGRVHSDNVSPEATLTYHPQQWLTLYGTYKTGYKAGGFGIPQVIGLAQTGNGSLFKPEKSHGGEIGFKGELLDRKLRVQVDAYTYDFKDLQTVVLDTTTVTYVYGNAAAARTRGAELQVDWAPTHQLTINGSLGYNQGRYLNYTTAPCTAVQIAGISGSCDANGHQSLSGDRLPYSPDWAGNLGFNYVQPVSDFNLTLYGNVNYRSLQNTSQNNLAQGNIGAYALLDGGVRFGPATGPWELSFIGRNLTNRVEPLSVSDQPGAPAQQTYTLSISRPREFWIEASLKF